MKFFKRSPRRSIKNKRKRQNCFLNGGCKTLFLDTYLMTATLFWFRWSCGFPWRMQGKTIMRTVWDSVEWIRSSDWWSTVLLSLLTMTMCNMHTSIQGSTIHFQDANSTAGAILLMPLFLCGSLEIQEGIELDVWCGMWSTAEWFGRWSICCWIEIMFVSKFFNAWKCMFFSYGFWEVYSWP